MAPRVTPAQVRKQCTSELQALTSRSWKEIQLGPLSFWPRRSPVWRVEPSNRGQLLLQLSHTELPGGTAMNLGLMRIQNGAVVAEGAGELPPGLCARAAQHLRALLPPG